MSESHSTPPWMHWPIDVFEEMQERLERFYEGGQRVVHQITRRPPADVRECPDRFVIDVELPGVAPARFDVRVIGRTVTVHATREPTALAEGERSVRQERRSGAYSRELTLPADVDAAGVRATYRAGVLHIDLPKLSADLPHKVEVLADD